MMCRKLMLLTALPIVSKFHICTSENWIIWFFTSSDTKQVMKKVKEKQVRLVKHSECLR